MAEILIEINKGSGTTTKNNAAKNLKVSKVGQKIDGSYLTQKPKKHYAEPNPVAYGGTAENTAKTGVFVGNGGDGVNTETKKENSKMPLFLGIAAVAALLFFNSSKGSSKKRK